MGTITIAGSGGTPGYQYSINGVNYFPSGLFTGLAPGSYTPWVRDANGCTKSSALLTIADFVNDAYESNNSKGQAKPITIGTGITARIATAADAADWFRFTTTVAGPYTVSLTHPSVAFTYNLFPSSPNNAAALVPVSTTATSKTYTLAAGISYSISVTGGLSVVCYNLVVNSGVAARVNNTTSPVVETVNKTSPVLSIDVLKTAIYPNPHLGSFTIRIESLVEGIGTVEVYTVNGQLLSERKVNLMKGKGNLVPYNNMKQAVLFYRVRIGSHIANGKIVGPN